METRRKPVFSGGKPLENLWKILDYDVQKGVFRSNRKVREIGFCSSKVLNQVLKEHMELVEFGEMALLVTGVGINHIPTYYVPDWYPM